MPVIKFVDNGIEYKVLRAGGGKLGFCGVCLIGRDGRYRATNPDTGKGKDFDTFEEAKTQRQQWEKEGNWIIWTDEQIKEHRKRKKSEKDKRYFHRNADKVKDKVKEYYYANKQGKIAEYRALPHVRVKKRKSDQRYQLENREKINVISNEYQKKRRQIDPIFRITQSYRALVRNGFKNKYGNGTTTKELLGCTWEEFVNHIEKQFENWMSWDNYGVYKIGGPRTWHIDHIISLANAKTEEELRKLFHYTNCRPYDSYKNISDGCRFGHLTYEDTDGEKKS